MSTSNPSTPVSDRDFTNVTFFRSVYRPNACCVYDLPPIYPCEVYGIDENGFRTSHWANWYELSIRHDNASCKACWLIAEIQKMI
jgi:hypothetical protein